MSLSDYFLSRLSGDTHKNSKESISVSLIDPEQAKVEVQLKAQTQTDLLKTKVGVEQGYHDQNHITGGNNVSDNNLQSTIISQKQIITPGRQAGEKNSVRGGILDHNDKLPQDGKIYSPVSGTVVGIKTGVRENKKGRSLSKPSFGNYVVIKVNQGPFAGKTYHLGHLDQDIPVTLGSKVNIGDHIGTIKTGSGSGTGRHYSDGIGDPDAQSMKSKALKGYENDSAMLANIEIHRTSTTTSIILHNQETHHEQVA
ncbi:MAG TPA: hypothetical protein PLW93_06495 [Candidatus Absconditabacterales bacterium]|nr:hypothetical protein [Candidatus Absconditabacterales bacterium]HNG97899.1 hypothetical protein [Candidatus Absconditabacterales bacterium]